MTASACLYVVATPIGNLEDLSPRAVQVLRDADVIAAEDTRHTGVLLGRLGIQNKELVSYYDAVEEQRAESLVQRLCSEPLQLVLVSDAGTPCISDPGYRLVHKARASGVAVVGIPGPCAVTTLVSIAGLACHRFAFVGFLPNRAVALTKEIRGWQALGMSVVCYEAARRLTKSLEAIRGVYPQAQVAVGRELTKLHEEVQTLPIADACHWASSQKTIRGEVVLMVEPRVEVLEPHVLAQEIFAQAKALQSQHPHMSHRDLVTHFNHCGLSAKVLYQTLLSLKDSKK